MSVVPDLLLQPAVKAKPRAVPAKAREQAEEQRRLVWLACK